jgi:hypothetical protein
LNKLIMAPVCKQVAIEWFHAGFLLGILNPEVGGDMFLRNVG